MEQQEIVQAALRTEIFKYVCACPRFQCCVLTARKQFTCLGYSASDIDIALTALQADGSISLTDDDMLKIGVPLAA